MRCQKSLPVSCHNIAALEVVVARYNVEAACRCGQVAHPDIYTATLSR